MEETRSSSDPRTSDPSRIHVLGLGNIGKLFAHSLANLPNPPPVTLLLHRSNLLPEWEKASRQITITTNDIANSNGHYDVEIISPPSSEGTSISNLIVATKTINTVSGLSSISHRLNSNSTVLFTQNGMGTLEEANAQVFKDVSRRPEYLTSIASHGVYSLGPFSSVHAGQAFISIGHTLQDSPSRHSSKIQSQYLINTILQSTVLAATEYPPQELLYLQLEKLVVNAMINPLTVLFNCENGDLFIHDSVLRLMRILLQETSQVLLALPEIQNAIVNGEERVERRFGTEELEQKVLDVARKTAGNTSSMLQDVRAGRETEIEYINGWFVRKGRELDVQCGENERVVEMVKAGKKIGLAGIEGYLGDKEL